MEHGKMICLSSIYVEDLIRTSPPQFRELSRKTHERFQMGEDEEVPCESMPMRLPWIANTQPDCLFEISQLAHITEDIFNSVISSLIRRLSKSTMYAINNRVALKVLALDSSSLIVAGFS
eukprot:IDg15391t1